MDLADLTFQARIITVRRQLQDLQERAKAQAGAPFVREGTPEDWYESFMKKLAMSTPNPRGTILVILKPFPPCTLPVSDLEPMKLADLTSETHHRGKMLTLRTASSPRSGINISAVVEDEDRSATVIQINHQPTETEIPVDELLPHGRVFIIKEPYYGTVPDARLLKICHISDMVFLENDDPRMPQKWRNSAFGAGLASVDLRQRGNTSIRNKKFFEAWRFYTLAINSGVTSEEKERATLNRALAHLKLGRPEAAMQDLWDLGTLPSPTEIQLYRIARASYDAEHYWPALTKLRALIAAYPNNNEAKMQMMMVKARIQEEGLGKYNFSAMYDEANRGDSTVNSATWRELVEVRPSSSPGRGNGLFVKTAVKAGQLLLCEKAYAYCSNLDQNGFYYSPLVNLDTGRATLGVLPRLLNKTVQKLYNRPRASEDFYNLHTGDYPKGSPSTCDGKPVVDSFLAEKVLSLNAIGAPQTSRRSFHDPQAVGIELESGFPHCGLWLLGARINHDCRGNCRRSFIGDMLIIRATRDLDANTELLFPYAERHQLEPWIALACRLQRWDILCNCDECRSAKEIPEATMEQRRNLYEELDRVLYSQGPERCGNDTRARKKLKRLEDTYPKPWPAGTRRATAEGYYCLGGYDSNSRKPLRGIRTVVQSLEAKGFEIIAHPHVDGEGQPPKLEVTRWGWVDFRTCHSFMHLYRLYKKSMPELCPPARHYLTLTYGMMVGETETLCDEWPELKHP